MAGSLVAVVTDTFWGALRDAPGIVQTDVVKKRFGGSRAFSY
jgi:hypothetical protein